MEFHKNNAIYTNTVSLNVKDLEKSTDFYTNIIGFKVLSKTETSVDFTVDGKHTLLRINLAESDRPNHRTSGLYHFALLLPKREDLALITMHLASKRVPLGSADHHVSEALYLEDIDGNGIEIYIDRDPDQWIWNDGQVHMVTERLNAEDLLKNQPNPNDFKGLPEGTIMGHVHFHVGNLVKGEEFYTEGLGLNVALRFGGQALFMSSENYHHHIAINVWNGVGAPASEKGTVGLDYFDLIYPSQDVLDSAVSRLTELGYQVEVNDSFVDAVDPSGTHVHLVTQNSHS
ncbi:VOC family protein [Jeotgalicoccus sp. ATCC 8456]|uniref:VOC family protein n=1 Tax=Jeotgalicoccus sp. ATCC 8456 TaxID=946435 RepID=UPI0018E63272|nr:VOC family protein [Jeotgalicoccus sp. ATCC 8456]QQD85140.1 VOC family protein [Jeotgalicoccus sp. ATCC 8456]